MSTKLTDYALIIFEKNSLQGKEWKQWLAVQLAKACPTFYTEALLNGKDALGKEFLTIEKLLETFLDEKFSILAEIVEVSKTATFTQLVELYYLKLQLEQLDDCIAQLEAVTV